MSKFGKSADEMNTINDDGKAFNGNNKAVALAFGLILVGIIVGIGYMIVSAFS